MVKNEVYNTISSVNENAQKIKPIAFPEPLQQSTALCLQGTKRIVANKN